MDHARGGVVSAENKTAFSRQHYPSTLLLVTICVHVYILSIHPSTFTSSLFVVSKKLLSTNFSAFSIVTAVLVKRDHDAEQTRENIIKFLQTESN